MVSACWVQVTRMWKQEEQRVHLSCRAGDLSIAYGFPKADVPQIVLVQLSLYAIANLQSSTKDKLIYRNIFKGEWIIICKKPA